MNEKINDTTSRKNILITGASGGLGYALAIHYANNHVRLVLLGRNEERLKKTARHCLSRGAEVDIVVADVCSENYECSMKKISKQMNFDLVIANAGCSSLESHAEPNDQSVNHISDVVRTNFEGQVKTIFPLLDGLTKQQGHIVIVSSFAAFRGLPQDPAYCASKAAASAFFEGCRPHWHKRNIHMTLIYPGFIDTAMVQKLSTPKPFLMSATKAASLIAKAVKREQYKLIFPFRLRLLFNLHRLLPAKWVDWLLLNVEGLST